MKLSESLTLTVRGLQALPQVLQELQTMRQELVTVTERIKTNTDSVFLQLKTYSDSLASVKTQLDRIISRFPF